MIRPDSARPDSKIADHIKTCCDFLFHYSNVSDDRMALLSSVRNTDATILQQINANLTHILLFGQASFYKNTTTFILEATADYLVVTRSFPYKHTTWIPR